MKKLSTLLFLMLTAAFVSAEARDLTIEEAVALGRENNLSLKMQDVAVAQAERENEDRWNVFIPDVSLTTTLARTNQASTGYGAMPLEDYSTTITEYNDYITTYDVGAFYEYDYGNWAFVADLSAQLVLNPAIGNGINALGLNLRSEQLNREIDEKQLEQNIKKYYYQLVQLQANIALLEKNIATTEQRYRDMEAMYRNGLITELDLLQTESGLASLTPVLTSLKNGYEQLRMAFCMDLGLPLNQELNLLDEITAENARTFDADKLVGSYLADNLDIQSLTLGKDMTENGRDAQNNLSMPSLILGWNYNPTVLDPFNGDNWSDDYLVDGDGGAFSVTVSIPLDDWMPHSTARNDVKALEDSLKTLDYQKELLYQATEMQIRQHVMTLDAAVQNLAVMEENVVLAQKTYDMSWARYRNGQMTATDLSQAENDLLQAESDLLGEKYTYISALLDLEYTVNRTLDKE
ncbi:MAG: TolC family protein [Spirochaetales bacterium]|nr:TolC family protein [Spirochaetales bacterium]